MHACTCAFVCDYSQVPLGYTEQPRTENMLGRKMATHTNTHTRPCLQTHRMKYDHSSLTVCAHQEVCVSSQWQNTQSL